MLHPRSASLVLAVLAVALLAGAVGSADEQRSGDLVGTWMFKVRFEYADGTAIAFRYLQTFNADGVTTLVLPDTGPGYTDGRSACVGEWKERHPRKYDMVTWCLESQELTGWLDKISARFTLSEDGRRISDPHFSAEWWLGDTYQGIGYGSMEGVRMSGRRR